MENGLNTLPVGSTPFMPAEEAVLRENGVTSFTSDDVASITRLVYPVHANSLQDILYFSNLTELDFTSWSLPTPVLSYPSPYPNHEVGGTSWYPFMRKGTDITEGKQILQDLLESGLLTKVKYYPHSMGLDEVLAPYVASGVVELLPLPAEVLIPQTGFYLNGLVQSYLWDLAVTFNPGDAPSPSGHQYIYKITLLEQNPTFCLALPVEYMFNVDEYKYLKMSVYAPAKSALAGWLENYQKIWIRPMNNLWGHPGNNPSPSSGQQLWNSNQYEIPDGDLQQWATITFDLSNSVGTHNRLIAINPGCELTPAWSMLVFYFADIRFTKE
ncbi:hypothetical protein SAMD00024442_51_2 [Candidatus Symbiothrix dinenymphae]|nr:hypothetical protein SAMD00024442_51_2 [Candidatus Symbiothrix dinenymphae]